MTKKSLFKASFEESLNLEDGIVMNVGNDTYVIKESFNKNRTMSEIIQKLIRVDINKLT